MKIAILEPLGLSVQAYEDVVRFIKALGHRILTWEEKAKTEESLAKRGLEAEAILVAEQPLSKAVLQRMPNLKMISVASAKTEQIDLEYCKKRGIVVCHTPGYATEDAAAKTFGLAYALLREISGSSGTSLLSGIAGGPNDQELFGKAFGLVGTGVVGTQVAILAKMVGCNVLVYDTEESAELSALGVVYMELNRLLRESDLVSLHMPLNEETKGMLGRLEMYLMQKHAVLINTADASLVETGALEQSFLRESISGAAINIKALSPAPEADSPLFSAKGVLMTPEEVHIEEGRRFALAAVAFENLRQWLWGKVQNSALPE